MCPPKLAFKGSFGRSILETKRDVTGYKKLDIEGLRFPPLKKGF
jgi:hypothetical protein